MLSRPPASFACATSLVHAALRIHLRTKDGGDRRVGHHLGQAIGTQQQSIAGTNVQRVRLDVHDRFRAADDVRDDVAEAVLGDLLGLKRSPADHVRHERVILRDLIQLAIPIQVRPAVPDVHDTQLCVELERHRHRRAHAAQLRMLGDFLENAGVGLAEGGLELREDSLRVGSVRVEKPLERIEGELLDRDDGKGTGLFAGAGPAHAVGDEKQMSAFVPELRLLFRQAGLPDAHRLGELGAEELILVGRAYAALVGDAERLHRQRVVGMARHGLVSQQHVRLLRVKVLLGIISSARAWPSEG